MLSVPRGQPPMYALETGSVGVRGQPPGIRVDRTRLARTDETLVFSRNG